MKYFDEDNGNYRNHGEGVKRKDEIIYMAPESILVPSLMKSLFEYISSSDLNIIILSAIFEEIWNTFSINANGYKNTPHKHEHKPQQPQYPHPEAELDECVIV